MTHATGVAGHCVHHWHSSSVLLSGDHLCGEPGHGLGGTEGGGQRAAALPPRVLPRHLWPGISLPVHAVHLLELGHPAQSFWRWQIPGLATQGVPVPAA